MAQVLPFILAFLRDNKHPFPCLTHRAVRRSYSLVVKSIALELEGTGSKIMHVQLKALSSVTEAPRHGGHTGGRG